MSPYGYYLSTPPGYLDLIPSLYRVADEVSWGLTSYISACIRLWGCAVCIHS
jgi:hypothetical protein